MMYIPKLDTIQALLKDEEVIKQVHVHNYMNNYYSVIYVSPCIVFSIIITGMGQSTWGLSFKLAV